MDNTDNQKEMKAEIYDLMVNIELCKQKITELQKAIFEQNQNEHNPVPTASTD